MSALLMGRVFYCDLPVALKFTLLAVADHANDDGDSIHVGQTRLATKVGVSERQLRRNLAELRRLGYLQRLQHGGNDRWSGHSFPDTYRLRIDRLPDVPKRVTPDTDDQCEGITPDIQRHNTGHPASITPDIAMSAYPSEEPSEEPPAGNRGDAAAFVAAYHRCCPMLPRCSLLTAKRRQHIAARLREHPLAEWERIFTLTAASEFHTGGGDRGWRADLDWLTRNAENALKILERGSPAKPKPVAFAAGGVRMRTVEETRARLAAL